MAALRQFYFEFVLMSTKNKLNTGAEYVNFGYKALVFLSLCRVKEIWIDRNPSVGRNILCPIQNNVKTHLNILKANIQLSLARIFALYLTVFLLCNTFFNCLKSTQKFSFIYSQS
jgi:hypothetical protein